MQIVKYHFVCVCTDTLQHIKHQIYIFVNMFYSVHIILQLALSRIFISFISLNTCTTLHTHIVNVAFPVIRYLYFQQFFQLQVTAIQFLAHASVCKYTGVCLRRYSQVGLKTDTVFNYHCKGALLSRYSLHFPAGSKWNSFPISPQHFRF